jgi:RNA polymerase sigma factor (sigma-70 family)
MLSMEEAEQLMAKFIELREKFNETQSVADRKALSLHQKECVEKFNYLVAMKTGRYKGFSNYEDLNQEGREALLKAMKTYKPNKGCFFAWSHHYIATRISRSANLHTTIRYPLKYAKANPPHKETLMPVQIEERFCPDKELETLQIKKAVRNAMAVLTPQQNEIICLAYGFDGDKPLSVNKICKKLKISRAGCIKTIHNVLSIMKENIKI